MPLDVKAYVSRPIEVEGGKVCGIAKSKGIENFGGTMFIGGEGYRHYLLPEALLIYAQEDPFMIKLDRYKYFNIVTKALVGWIDGICISYPI
jgi:hypothetical protein